MHKCKVHVRRSLFEPVNLGFGYVGTSVVRTSVQVDIFVCEYIWLTGGTQWGPWLIMVVHAVGSESYQYNLNGKETMWLGCLCFTMRESWHLACVEDQSCNFLCFPTVLCGFWKTGSH